MKNLAIFCDIKDSFFLDYIDKLKKKLSKNYKLNFFNNYNHQKKKCNIAFFIACRKKIKKNHIQKNKVNVVVHPSKLPIGKGSGAVSWTILEKKNKIWITLFKPDLINFDSGCIYMQDYFKLNGTELSNKIRAMQAKKIIEMICIFLKKYEKNKLLCLKQPKSKKNNKKHYRIRTPLDSELDINKKLVSQFNLMRVSDNERYPAFFKYKGKKYTLKIYES
tara:strand:- start:496 stop:1155 length:660 start_codon:yes stop_codon:yes gene_type:complete